MVMQTERICCGKAEIFSHLECQEVKELVAITKEQVLLQWNVSEREL
jgi:hypothetical protein